MRVDVNKVREAVKWLEEIDKMDFTDIEWVDGNESVKVATDFAEYFNHKELKSSHFALLKFDKKVKN